MRHHNAYLPTVLAALALSIAHGAPVEAQQKVRIAVMDFANNSGWTYWGEQLGSAAADELVTQLVKSGEFSVIERERLQAILAEQQLGMSGAVTPSTAARIGELLGVQAILTGSITQFSIDRKSGGIGPVSANYTEAESRLDVRVVDTTTGEILLVAEGDGKKRLGGFAVEDVNFEQSFDRGVAQEALRPAVEKAVDRVLDAKTELESLEAPAARGNVVGANEGSYYVDRGENFGIEVGQRFDVYRVVDEIRDASGTLLDTVTEKVGVLEVTRVLSQSSICSLVEGEAAEGDEVRATDG